MQRAEQLPLLRVSLKQLLKFLTDSFKPLAVMLTAAIRSRGVGPTWSRNRKESICDTEMADAV